MEVNTWIRGIALDVNLRCDDPSVYIRYGFAREYYNCSYLASSNTTFDHASTAAGTTSQRSGTYPGYGCDWCMKLKVDPAYTIRVCPKQKTVD